MELPANWSSSIIVLHPEVSGNLQESTHVTPTMRTIVYAAAVYAACVGCAEAFTPLPSVPSVRNAPKSSLCMGEDPAAVMARVNAMMNGGSPAAASAERSYTASFSAPSYKPPVSSESAASIVARVNSMTGGPVASKPSSMWRWSGKDVGGYNPAKRSSFAPSRAGSSASAAPRAEAREDPAAVMARVMAMMK